MANRDLPRAQGLYDPAYEHDACGVAFVVDLHGRKSHEMVGKGITALCNLQHRGASGCEVNTGDGAGILLQIPDRFLRAVVDFELPRSGAYATGIAFLPKDPADADKAVAAIDAIVADEGLRVLGWRDVPTDDSMLGGTARSVEPSFRQLFIAGDGLAGPRAGAPRVHRAQADRARGRGARGPRARLGLLPEPLVPDARLQGDAHHPAARGVLRRPPRRAARERARARALAVLHQHVPVVAARAPVPLHRAQRRDQHAEGQPQLDAGPRGAARVRPVPGRPRPRVPDLHARRVGLVVVRRGARAARARRPLAAALGADDDPGGVGEPHLDERGEEGVLPVPRVADGAVGRPRVDRVHRRHRHRCGARPQRSAAVAVLGDRPTAS